MSGWYKRAVGLGLASAVFFSGLSLGGVEVSAATTKKPVVKVVAKKTTKKPVVKVVKKAAAKSVVKKASVRDVPVRAYKPINETKASVTKSGYTVSYDAGKYSVYGKVSSKVDVSKIVTATVAYGSGYKKTYDVKMKISKGILKGTFNAKQAYGDQAVKLEVWDKPSGGVVYVNNYGWYQFRIKDVNFAKKPSKYVQSTDKGIVSLAKSVTAGKKTDLDKSRAIYAYVAKHVKYDVKQYKTGNAIFYSSTDTLKRKVAMCTGYANLSAAMHRAIGIEAQVVYGYVDGGLHAWNEIHVGKSWYFQDPTFGAGYVDLNKGTFTFNYTDKYLNVAYPKTHKKTGVYEF